MSVSKWAYIPERCDGEPCPGDCDVCSKAEECPPNVSDEECMGMDGGCRECWETFGAVEPPKEET